MSSSSSNKHLGGGSSSEGNYPHLICKQKNKYIGLVSPQQQLTVNPVPPPLRLAPTTCPRHPLHRVEGWAVTTYEQVLFFRPLVYKKKKKKKKVSHARAARCQLKNGPLSSARRQGQRLVAAVRQLVLRSRSEAKAPKLCCSLITPSTPRIPCAAENRRGGGANPILAEGRIREGGRQVNG